MYNEDYNPLLRRGDLYESIEDSIVGDTVTVGSESEIMVWQEEGTETIPARPVLGPAMYESRKEIKALVDMALKRLVMGKTE